MLSIFVVSFLLFTLLATVLGFKKYGGGQAVVITGLLKRNLLFSLACLFLSILFGFFDYFDVFRSPTDVNAVIFTPATLMYGLAVALLVWDNRLYKHSALAITLTTTFFSGVLGIVLYPSVGTYAWFASVVVTGASIYIVSKWRAQQILSTWNYF